VLANTLVVATIGTIIVAPHPTADSRRANRYAQMTNKGDIRDPLGL
jgi:hypothetical protein